MFAARLGLALIVTVWGTAVGAVAMLYGTGQRARYSVAVAFVAAVVVTWTEAHANTG